MDKLGVILAVLAFANGICAHSNVPVLMWNTHQANDVNIPSVSALQQYTVSTFQTRHLDAFQPNNILLFLQDALSIEDLSAHSAEFNRVKDWMDEGHSLYVPNLQEPGQLQHALLQQGYKRSTLTAGTAVSELKLVDGEKNLVVVKLPPTLTSPSRSKSMKKSVEVMQSVLSKIGDAAGFTVIYTGLKPSVDNSHSSDSERVRVSRSLQFVNAPKPPPNLHNGTCILIYFRQNMTISLNGKLGPYYEIIEKPNDKNTIATCADANSQDIQLSYDNVKLGENSFYKLKIRFFFDRVGAYWKSPRADVTLNEQRSSTGETHKLQLTQWFDDSVPLGWSYSCGPTLAYQDTQNTTSLNVQLHVNGVQVQAFINGKSDKFGNAWDCVGFFSIGILAGLFATLIAVIILAYGMSMLASIKTMDRFDDPKGKSIVVPQSQE